MTFSVPEIEDFRSRATTISAFGEFSTVEFTLIGFGEPRVVQAGVVNGAFFEVMGLRPLLGRLLSTSDDGPNAAGVAVLTHRFWATALNSDPTVIGKKHRPRSAFGDGGRRARTVRAIPGRHRDHREHGDESASSRRDDGHSAHTSDDGAVRPFDTGRHG